MEWILDHRSAELTALFKAFTHLGDAGFFMVFLPLGYWLWRPGLLTRFSLLLLASAMLNVTLKETFQVPRPEGDRLIHALGWSFPSGHAQNAAAIWPWLALQLGSWRPGTDSPSPPSGGTARWLWPAVVVMVLGVATSRVYLGVHTPRDVIAGTLIGGTLALVAWRLEGHRPTWWSDLGPHPQAVIIATGVAVWTGVILGISSDPAASIAGGALAGFWIGAIYQRHGLRFVPSVEGWQPLAVIALGLGGVVALRVGLKAAFAAAGMPPGVDDLIRYAVIAAWISFFGPWLFVRLGLMRARPGL